MQRSRLPVNEFDQLFVCPNDPSVETLAPNVKVKGHSVNKRIREVGSNSRFFHFPKIHIPYVSDSLGLGY